MQAPAYCQEIVKLTNLVNVYSTESRDIVLNDKGYTREIVTTVQHFEYLTDKGTRVELPYRVKGVPDVRSWKSRHPVLWALGPLLPGIVWNLIQLRT